MTTKDEALKLALEALEDTLSGDLTPYQAAKTITAIREALAEQPAQQQDLPDFIAGALGVSRGTAYDLMREALAEQPAQQQEPLFWYDEEEGWLHDNYDDAPSGCIPLYTSPPASKPWMGLTNQELIDLTAIYSGAPLYCAIEAKLREKNT